MKIIRPEELTENPFKMIGKDWMLITAEKDGIVNMMTASWGGLGFLWNKPVATIYLRPTRYTKEFIDAGDTFSLCVLPKEKKSVLDYCGCHSGRDGDKVSVTKLSVEHMNGTPWFAESRIVLICRKLYAQTFDSFCFTDEKICEQNYRNNDFHTMYVAEVQKAMISSK
jgi:flavin reductase (DIM6/NTAB) family NADH-FMN oxidoreductase RutF